MGGMRTSCLLQFLCLQAVCFSEKKLKPPPCRSTTQNVEDLDTRYGFAVGWVGQWKVQLTLQMLAGDQGGLNTAFRLFWVDGHSPCTSLPLDTVSVSGQGRSHALHLYRVCCTPLGSCYKPQVQTKPSNGRYTRWCSYQLCAMELGKLEVEIGGKSPFQVLSFLLNISYVVQRAARVGAELFCVALGT